MGSRTRLTVAAAVMLLAQMAGAWEIKLDVKDEGWQLAPAAGPRLITCGVPLLAGQAKEPDQLRLAVKDEQGKLTAVPAQFRVLARWWQTDGSIRWVLVDTQTVIEAGGSKSFYLTDARLDAPAVRQAVAVEETPDAITVHTGPARFVVSRKKFNFLDKAVIDLNGDGKLGDDENVLASSDECGTVVQDTHGQRYLGSAATDSVEVVEAGPLRACVRARGRHVAPEGKGYSPGMYGYDVFLNFYAGGADVCADVIVTNNPPRSIGAPTFEDASLVLKLAGGAAGYRLVGEKPLDGKLGGGESVCLYQDSNGADTWSACPGFGHMDSPGWKYPKGTITSFRGFQVYRRTDAAAREATSPDLGGEVIDQGDHARGLLQVANGRGGLIVHTKKFWQQFPKAVEAAADGTVRVGLFPRECKVVHYLEDTSAKGHEIVLHFYGPKTQSGYATDSAGRPDAAKWADCWDGRLMFRPPVEHAGACGALADMPYSPPVVTAEDVRPDTRIVPEGPKMLSTDQLYGNAYGWQVFGERWRSQGGHGRRGARQPIDQDNYLWRWYVTGSPMWYAAGDNRSRHFRDVRCFRIDGPAPAEAPGVPWPKELDGQDAFGFKDWAEFRKANKNEDWTNRPQPKGEEYDKYSQGRWSRSDWLFPNPEHTVLDLVYDRYVLFGDVRSLEDMRIAAAHGGYFAGRGGSPLTGSWQWRANGWGWRALYRYWELTGDKAAWACLQDVMTTHAAHVGKAPLFSIDDKQKDRTNWWFTGIYCRAVSMTAVTTRDPRMLELCKTLAVGKEERAGRVPALFAALYHLTGEQRYRKAVLGEDDGARLLTVGGYFPACDHWLAHQPPKPLVGGAGR